MISLHFGSLVAAVGSYLAAKFNHGNWLVRIEDLGWRREVLGVVSEILHTFERLGMEWDGDVIYQSKRSGIYQNALDILDKQELIYPCSCLRKEITDSSIMGISGPRYILELALKALPQLIIECMHFFAFVSAMI